MRTHESFSEVDERIAGCNTATAKDKIAKATGIKGLPALRRVGSMHNGRSSPWDFMHLAFENNIPNLYKFWTGNYKSLDTGDEDYVISPEEWVIIWQETADAMQYLPADFVRLMGSGPEYFTAESWCFWIAYMAPILLEGRFSNPKYHVHLCQYSDIVKQCMSFVLTYTEIDELETNIIDWVRTYEKYYYQYKEERLSACPLTIHGLLHVPDNIRFCGPSWTTWTFWVEHYCGFLQAGLRSKRFPWANVNNRILHYAYLEQLGARYDLKAELTTASRPKGELSRTEFVYQEYPQSILRAPYKRNNIPDSLTRRRMAGYFSAVLGKRIRDIQPRLPENMPSWGKVRIVDGDSIRCSSDATNDETNPGRDTSFIRYEIQVQDDNNDWVSQIFYGRLQTILLCDLPEDPFWNALSGTKRLLAVIAPCKTFGLDAAKKHVYFTVMTNPIVTDLRTVVAVVGRFETQGQWAVIDRTGGLVKPTFLADPEVYDHESRVEDETEG